MLLTINEPVIIIQNCFEIDLTDQLIDIMNASGKYFIMESCSVSNHYINKLNAIKFDITFVDNPVKASQLQRIDNIDLTPIINSLI